MAASSSSSKVDLQKKYDVFISFHGEDVRYNFLSHLFNALTRKQINAFKDENLERGEEISASLLNLIKESHISIVIFSKNYPYSTWCLEELAQIHECSKKRNQIVIPVFHHVDPDHVQKLDESYGAALIQHQQKFKDKVETWSSALKEIGCISGFVSSPFKPEGELIEKIADEVNEKLSHLQSSGPQYDGLFGIDSHVDNVESLLRIEMMDRVHVVGIWGMGGMGKTTIADKLFNKIKKNFDAHCFVPNVRESLEKRAPNDLRDEVFRELLGDKKLNIGTPHSLEPYVKRRLQCKKVLLVFDDVIDSNHLMLVLGDTGLYRPGSRVIITSRDSQVLKNVGTNQCIYHVEGLSDIEAFKLFSWRAFHQNHPKEEYMKLSKEAIKYAGGVPLALIVLGSNLYNKSIKEWEDELEKVKNIPDKDIQKILRISYDGLERTDKAIFLDIACIFKGQEQDSVKEELKSFRLSTERGINRLLDKSLITLKYGEITMHDLLEQMGKEIVIEESNNTLGEQSRLWKSKDIIHVLRNNLGNGKVEAISLNMEEIDEKFEISSTAFRQMRNLRFLKINLRIPFTRCHGIETKVLSNGLEFLPENLHYLQWDKYPLSYLPPNFCPENLVELHMPFSQLKELRNVEKCLKSLKWIDLSYSIHLMKIPDFSKCPNLQHLELMGCSSLVEISWSNKAQSWSRIFNLSGCTSLCRLLEIPYNIEVLNLEGTSIKQLPQNMGCEKYLRDLNVSNCVNLQKFPENLGNFKRLRDLNCSGCKGLKLPPLDGLINLVVINLSNCHMSEFPNGLCSLTSLEDINLSGNNFKSIPANIIELFRLEMLYLEDCKKLEYIPELPPSLIELLAPNCTSLESVSIAVLPQLLVLRDCINLKQQESWSTMLNDVLEQHLSGNKLIHGDYCMLSIAGSELPQNMKYKNNNGSSLSVTLDCHDLIGFSLCIVVAPKYSEDSPEYSEDPPKYPTSIQCWISVLPENAFVFSGFGYESESMLLSESENMFLWYTSYNKLCSTENEIKVSFRLTDEYGGTVEDGPPIVKCGFSPVYKNNQRPIQILEEGQGSNLKSRKRKHQDSEGNTTIYFSS